MHDRFIKRRSINWQVNRMLVFMSVLFILLCAFINRSMQRILISNANEHTMITAKKLEDQLNFLYDKMNTFSLAIAGREDVQGFLAENYAEKIRLVESIQEMTAYYKILDPTIVDIAFINDDLRYSGFFSEEELKEMRENNEEKSFSWLGVRKSRFISPQTKPTMLLYGREVYANGEDVGTLILCIDTAQFFLDGDDEMHSYYLLADDKGAVYAFNATEEVSGEIWDCWNDGGKPDRFSDGNWFIQSTYSESMGCYQLSALNMRQVSQNLITIKSLVWGCVILIVLFMFLFWGLIRVELVKPLRDFHDAIRRIREQKERGLKEKLRLQGCTEMVEIGEEFTGMMGDIEQLNRRIFDTATDLYEMKIKSQEAQLSYMRSQIDPHFLYNTLEAFRKMAMQKDAPELAQMAVDMGNIFRYSTKGGTNVRLADEIAIIKSYIRIQQKRFRGKIEVFYFLPRETLEVPVMKMLLQPLVENAIYHGLEPKEEKGNLYIGARLEEDKLILTVKDDGVGIPHEKLRELNELLKQDHYDTSRHVGILNTQARIRLQYGKPYGITVESEKLDGTTVTLVVPTGEGCMEG